MIKTKVKKLIQKLDENILNDVIQLNLNNNFWDCMGEYCFLDELEVKDILEENMVFDFKIVNKENVKGNLQRNKHEIFVNQTTGYLGDDFYGQCYVKLTQDKYLCWSYSC